MRQADEEPRSGSTAFPTLGVYITTKGIAGQTPKILRTRNQSTFFVGRASSLCDIVFPQPFISKVHGKIEYNEGIWSYTNLGENKTYFCKEGRKCKVLHKGYAVDLSIGDTVSLLFKEPLYVLEFFPDLEKDEDVVDREPTKPGGANDLSYIDTKIELIVWVVSMFDHNLKTLPLSRLLLFLLCVVLLGGWIAWLVF